MTAEISLYELEDSALDASRDSLKGKLDSIVVTAESLDVSNEEGFRKMTALYAESKDWEKRIEFIRKQANQPDQDRINARNDRCKDLLAPLKQIQAISKKKCDGYQLILESRKKEEEAKLRATADLLGLDDIPFLAPLEKSQRGAGAVMFTRVVRKFRTVDLSKVPLKYLQVNEDLIKQDINLGVAEIPGIEIYDEKVTQLKTR